MKKELRIVTGNLIGLALQGEFDVIAHGCNCFCAQKSGLAPQMVRAFGTDKYPLELFAYKDKYGKVIKTKNLGDVNKLGQVEGKVFKIYDLDGNISNNLLEVVNVYSQFEPGYNSMYPDRPPVNYEALRLAFAKMNRMYKGSRIGLPKIGCELAGGDIEIVKQMMIEEFTDCDVTLVEFDGIIVNNYKEQYKITEVNV